MPLNKGYLTANKSRMELFTPYYAVDPILKYLSKDKIIWCPFDESWSAFYQRLTEEGYTVIRSCLRDGQDFFSYEPDNWDIIVTNPPFTEKDKVIKRLYSFNKPFAVLLPLNSLQGKTRYKYFSQGVQLLAFDARICFHDVHHMDNPIKGTPFATAYFCRKLLPKDLIVEEIKPYIRSLQH